MDNVVTMYNYSYTLNAFYAIYLKLQIGGFSKTAIKNSHIRVPYFVFNIERKAEKLSD